MKQYFYIIILGTSLLASCKLKPTEPYTGPTLGRLLFYTFEEDSIFTISGWEVDNSTTYPFLISSNQTCAVGGQWCLEFQSDPGRVREIQYPVAVGQTNYKRSFIISYWGKLVGNCLFFMWPLLITNNGTYMHIREVVDTSWRFYSDTITTSTSEDDTLWIELIQSGKNYSSTLAGQSRNDCVLIDNITVDAIR